MLDVVAILCNRDEDGLEIGNILWQINFSLQKHDLTFASI